MVKKRWLTGILAVTMIVGAINQTTIINAAEGREQIQLVTENVDSDFNIDGTGILIRYRGAGGDVVIPDSVTGIGVGAFANCGSLKSVTIPSSVKIIQSHAFYSCKSLTQVTIMEGVKKICDSAFESCSVLTSITIPSSVETIESGAFSYCKALEDITIPSNVTSIGDSAFSDCDKLTGINVDEKNTVYSSENGVLYSKDKSLLKLYPIGKTEEVFEIPIGVTTIQDAAFSNCKNLKKVTLSGDVETIGSRAFYECSNLENIEFSASIAEIDSQAFIFCTSLKAIDVDTENTMYSSENGVLYNKNKSELLVYPSGKTEQSFTIPDGVISIGEGAFFQCKNLNNILIPDSVQNIEYQAFSGSGVTSVKIPDSVTKISDRAFAECRNLTSVKIPDGVTNIGLDAFIICTSLTDIVIPDSVTEIGIGAFSECTSLTGITIPSSVIYIGNNAFWKHNEELVITCEAGSYVEQYAKDNDIKYKTMKEKKEQTITASNITKTIGDVAFHLNASSDGDGTLTYESDNTSIATVNTNGMVTLTGVGTAHIKITASATDTYKAAEKTITLTVKEKATSDDTEKPSDDKKNLPEKGTTLKSGKTTYKVLSKGKAVTYVKTSAKAGSVSVPATVKIDKVTYKVTAISDNAFKNSKYLKKVTIGSNVKTIGNGAFSGCKKLTSVSLGKNVTFVGKDTFKNCIGLKKITIPDKVTTVGNTAFTGCKKMSTVTLGKSVKKIGTETFKGCSKLGTVTIKSTKLKSVGKNAFKGIKSNVKIKVPVKQLKAYKKLLKGKGLSSKAKITK